MSYVATTLASTLFLCTPLTAAGAPPVAAQAEVDATSACRAQWAPTFGGLPGVVGPVHAQAVYPDPQSGQPMLYVGGMFEVAGGVPASLLARWDGSSWSSVAGSPSSPGPVVPSVRALAVFDDGNGAGPGLYVAGQFTTAQGQPMNSIARLDAGGWSNLGAGVTGSSATAPILAMTVFDDGAGPALYVAGTFSGVDDGLPMNHIARWDGSSWSSLGSGIDAGFYVHSLGVHDDGTGPALYAGGQFTQAGGVAVSNLARWDGAAWSDVGGGVNGHVYGLASFDDGSGPALFAAGSFGQAGGQPAPGVARWDGAAWSAVGGGAAGTPNLALALEVLDLGGGAALYAGGSFSVAGGGHATVALWNGTAWLGAGNETPTQTVLSLDAFDAGDGAGPKLFAGGAFQQVGALMTANIAAFDGSMWSALGEGLGGPVTALTTFDPGDGGGSSLYVAGSFLSIGNTLATRIARWNAGSWSPLGSGVDGAVNALETYDLGGGPELFAGGTFTNAGGQAASKIARWDGASWAPLGTGMDQGVEIRALLGADLGDGQGPGLFACGGFQIMGGVATRHTARWDGAAWSPLGTGPNSRVFALTTFDPGTGPLLIAGGLFTEAGGVPAQRIAAWDGSSWSALGLGVAGGANPSVHSLAVFDDGNGAALYVGGWFATAGGVPAQNIARWDGTGWSAVGGGVTPTVVSLTVFDDGGGPALYAGGSFIDASGVTVNHIARWDGSSWSALGQGLWFGNVDELLVFDDGGGAALYAGGSFRSAPDSGDSYLAKWGCAAQGELGDAFCFGDGSGSVCPCANPGAAGQGCANGTGQGAILSAAGSASVGAADLVLSATNLIPSQFGLYLQGNNRLNGGLGTPFGDGLRCVGGGLVRLQARAAGPTGQSSTSIDIAAKAGLSGGETRSYQLWYRDAFTTPCGQGFNLTNALELVWIP